MKQRILSIIVVILVSLGLVVGVVWAASETEPNNNPGEANPITAYTIMDGEITPIGDVDYFALDGVNTLWGFIALLETEGSGTLTALGSDGTTVLQSDTGSWENGSGIALQNYANGSATHYLRVNESGNDATIPAYALRYYKTVVATKPEIEPNEITATGTPSAFTHNGTLSTSSDVDCFSFQGRDGDTILLALDTDSGSPANSVLELRDFADTVLQAADFTGTGGNEFLEYADLPGDGVYAYCVRVTGGSGGLDATYRVGIVRNGGLYFPTYQQKPTWLNPRPGNIAYVGDTLTFQLAMTNTSPIAIPGDINFSADYLPGCLNFLDANPTPTSQSSGEVSWDGLQPGGLAPGEVYSVTLNLQAIADCADEIRQHTYISYFLTGTGNSVDYTVYSNFVYLPLILRR
jgi:hypothetical protein